MSQRKSSDEYQYGKACEDHLGNKFRTIKAMCEQYGIPDSTYQTRKRHGWELERILTTPPQNYTWHSPNKNMGIPMTKTEKKKQKDYREMPDSRLLSMRKYQRMAELLRNSGADEHTVETFIQQEMEMNEFSKGEGTTDIETIRLWNSYPVEAKKLWLHNAFCGKCGSTSFKPGYNLRKNKFGVVIDGYCDKCSGRIVRCCD